MHISFGIGFPSTHTNWVPQQPVPVYRYYHDRGNHFFTTNASEIGVTQQGQVGNHGYKSEGVAFMLMPNPAPGFVPVHRYHNAGVLNHLYTTNAGEIGTTQVGAAGNHGYVYEGILGYISQNPAPGLAPVYRYYHSGLVNHLYSARPEEIGATQPGQSGNHGYVCEGILGYAFDVNHQNSFNSGAVPVHRYYHEGVKNHLYTANAGEIGATTVGQVGNHGYKYEGVSFRLLPREQWGWVPVYRYFNGAKHDHFYTANPSEIGTTVPGQAGAHGYVCEGVLGHISLHQYPGLVPVYRYFNGGVTNHLYTTNASEIGTTTPGQAGNHGYTSEGILGYALP